MTKFEQYLIDNGYIRFIDVIEGRAFNITSIKLKRCDKDFEYSTIGILRCSYYPSNDPFLKNIEERNFYTDVYTKDETKNMIVFGLNEHHKPPTLCYPRPNMWKSEDDGTFRFIYPDDDHINRILMSIPCEYILESLFKERMAYIFDKENIIYLTENTRQIW